MVIELEYIFNNEGATLDFDFYIDLSAYSISGNKLFPKPFLVEGKVFNKTNIVRMKATAVSVMRTQCDRCAGDIEERIEVPVEHILVASLNDENNDDFILVESLCLELEPLITEDIFLALPSRILCKNDCKGLCPYCGQNLNNGQCSCQKPVDPRLEALKQLLDNQ
ncbi:MAG: DUF177 domain-containing protein [Clostridiales bacterium]|nr:DUF177 domain-containing protein [Clostridiales bacterium]